MNEAHAGAEQLVPDTPRRLAVVTASSVDGTVSIPKIASEPPVPPFTSPFIGQSAEEVSKHADGVEYFVVLDKRSTEDDSAVLVDYQPGPGGVQTVRATFDSAQHLLTAVEMATLGFNEIQQIADSSGGVYGTSRGGVQKGGPAPAMRLGGN